MSNWWNADDNSAEITNVEDSVSRILDKNAISSMKSKAVKQKVIAENEEVVCLSSQTGCTNLQVFEGAASYANRLNSTVLIQVGYCPQIAAIRPNEKPSDALCKWSSFVRAK